MPKPPKKLATWGSEDLGGAAKKRARVRPAIRLRRETGQSADRARCAYDYIMHCSPPKP